MDWGKFNLIFLNQFEMLFVFDFRIYNIKWKPGYLVIQTMIQVGFRVVLVEG